jgi:predicted enzyme related to lactoylglutathione lyase
MSNDSTPINVMNWFEVATDDPETAANFYSSVFGWTFQPFDDPSVDYRVATGPGAPAPFGGIAGTPPGVPAHAIFYVQVADVAAACTAIEQHGGKVVERQLAPAAGPAFAYVHDPVGSLFGVYARPV